MLAAPLPAGWLTIPTMVNRVPAMVVVDPTSRCWPAAYWVSMTALWEVASDGARDRPERSVAEVYGPRPRRVTSMPSILVAVGMAAEPRGGWLIWVRTRESATLATCVSRAMASTVEPSRTAPPATDRPVLLAPVATAPLPLAGLSPPASDAAAVTVMSVPIPLSVRSTAACALATPVEAA